MSNSNPIKRMLSLMLAAVLLLGLTPLTALAMDYEGHWAAPYIEKANERGWMLGDGNGNFKPDDSITRGEFSVMLWRALGEPEPQGDCPFTDISDDAYYREAVTALYETGVVSGYGGGLFGPDDTLTREMAFVMLSRAFDLAPGNAGEAAEYTRFDDYADVSAWATDAASIMALKGYVSGADGKLMPKKPLTRGEMAKLLVTVYDGENAPPDDEKPEDKAGPAITFSQSPTASTTGNVTVAVTATDDSGVAYIGWRSSSSGAKYSDKIGFTDITSKKEFSVSSNGWYAVCAVDSAGNFAFKLIQITNIQTSSGGGGGGSSTTYYSLSVGNITGQTATQGSAAITTGSATGNVSGSSPTVTATPAAGYQFVKWTSDAAGNNQVSAANSYTFNITANTSLYAVFELIPASTYTFNTPGSISANGVTATVTYAPNSPQTAGTSVTATVTLSGTAAATGVFTIDLTSTKAGLTANPKTKTVTAANTAMTAGDVYTFTFTVPSLNVDDLTLAFTFSPVTYYTVTVDEMTATAAFGSLAATPSVTATSVSATQLDAIVTPGTNYSIEGYYTTDNPAGTKVIFPITADATVYVRYTGDGVDAPINIATAAELEAINNDLTKSYILLNDIDVGNDWSPIGAFPGTFDGRGHTVTIKSIVSSHRVGLFGVIKDTGEVRNVSVTSNGAIWNVENFNQNSACGGITGYNQGLIENCVSSANIAFTCNIASSVGGIAGNNEGTVKNCYSTGSVSISGTDASYYYYAGGIVGNNLGGMISGCYASGTVTSTGGTNTYAGGIAGRNESNVNNCVALNTSISGQTINRIVGWHVSGALTNNRAISIGSLTGAGTLTDADGLLITLAGNAVDQDIFGDATGSIGAGWKFLDIPTDDDPWVWDSGTNLPKLWWSV